MTYCSACTTVVIVREPPLVPQLAPAGGLTTQSLSLYARQSNVGASIGQPSPTQISVSTPLPHVSTTRVPPGSHCSDGSLGK